MAVKSFTLKILAVIALCISCSGFVHAASIEITPGCDPDFLDVMEAKAWMEGQREVEMASRLILKPDSVLEYSCFYYRISELGLAANTMFGDNYTAPGPLYSNPTNAPGAPLTNTNLNNMLGDLVGTPQFNYEFQNFGHTYAGGFYAGPGSTVCRPMALVWDFLKCSDYNKNYFQTFTELAAADPRTVPTYLAHSCNDGNRAANWANAIAAANPAPALPAASGGMDDVENYNAEMMHTGGACAPPLETGITVVWGSGTHRDMVCPTPGCYHDRSGNCEPGSIWHNF